jgi:hypothetical protein
MTALMLTRPFGQRRVSTVDCTPGRTPTINARVNISTESIEKKARAVRERRERTHAGERATGQKGSAARLARTIVLGTMALSGAIVWIGDQYGIDPEETIQFLSYSAIFVVALVFAGFFGALMLSFFKLLVRRLLGRPD